MSSKPIFSDGQLKAQADAISRNAPVPAPAPALPSDEGVSRQIHVVPEPTEADKKLSRWRKLEREARAKRLGVTPESLEPVADAKENWRDRLVTKAPADPAYAGLYHLTGGAVCMPGGLVAEVGTYVELNAEDGQHITDRGIGVLVGV